MEVDNKLSGSATVSILSLLMVGTGILSLPRFLLEASEVDTWLIILVGGMFLAILGLIYGYIISLFPGKGYVDILSLTLTKPITYLLCSVKIIYLITLAGLSIRIFAEVLKGSLFPMTPIEVIILGMISVGGYGARQGIETLGRFAKLLFLIMVPLSILIFSLGLIGADPLNLLPVFEISFEDLVSAIPRITYSFIGFETILIFGMFLNKPRNARKVGVTSVVLVMLLYLFINVITIAQFGTKQTMALVWPTLSLIRSVDIPLGFVEDVTVVASSLWVFAIFMSYLPLLMGNSIILGQMTRCKENNFFPMLQLPLIYFAAMIPDNVPHIYLILDNVTKYFAPLFLFIIPAFILIIKGIKSIVTTEGKTKS